MNIIALVLALAAVPCERAGSVVVVPGLLGGAYGFRQVTSALERAGHHVIVVEPLGYGDAARPSGADYSLHAQSARLQVALDSAGLCDAVLIGHSLGAGIAMRIAASRPDLVRGVVAIEGGAADAALGPGGRFALSLAPMMRFAARPLMRAQVRRKLEAQSVNDAWLTDATFERYAAPMSAEPAATLRAMQAMARAVESRPLDLARVRAPVVVLMSAPPGVTTIPDRELAAMRAQLQLVDFRAVAGTGHFIHEERPDVVISATLELLGVRGIALSRNR